MFDVYRLAPPSSIHNKHEIKDGSSSLGTNLITDREIIHHTHTIYFLSKLIYGSIELLIKMVYYLMCQRRDMITLNLDPICCISTASFATFCLPTSRFNGFSALLRHSPSNKCRNFDSNSLQTMVSFG